MLVRVDLATEAVTERLQGLHGELLGWWYSTSEEEDSIPSVELFVARSISGS